MSKFNCQVGEAIEFPRQQERRFPKKDKCCGFVGATVVADATFEGPTTGSNPILTTGEVVPLTANTLIGFSKVSDETFTALSCGTYSVTLKVRAVAPGESGVDPFAFRIDIAGCGPTRPLDMINIPEDSTRTFSINRTVCLRKGEGIRVVTLTDIDLTGNEILFLVLSASKISDCCDDTGSIAGSCRSCSCDKCDRDNHDDHHHSNRCDRW